MKAFLTLVLLLLPVALGAQTADGRVYFDAIAFAAEGSDSSAIDLYLAVPYTAINLERTGRNLTGRYQAHVKVEGNGRVWFDSTYVRTVVRQPGSNGSAPSDGLDFYQQRITLPAGSYSASVELLDQKTSLVTTAKRTATAIDYAKYPFALSGLLLVGKIREDSAGYVITPLLTENVSSVDGGYFLFFEVYNKTAREAFQIEALYKTPAGVAVDTVRVAKSFPRGRSQQWIRLPNDEISRGAYIVEVKAYGADDTTKPLAAAQRSIRFEGGLGGVPVGEEELNEKIMRLRYIATQSEIDAIRDETNVAARRRKYAEFWQKHDPTPETPENEAMDEYFGRIEYADAHFRSYAAGWLTDKGKVYVIYGPPDFVAPPNSFDAKTVETWQYYSRNMRISFVDENGFGDYRLLTPIPAGEKYRYRK